MIGIKDIEAAAARLGDVVVRTPLLRNAELDRVAGGTVLIKPECFQSIGSFKIRGAYNLLSQLTPEQAEKGVVAWSSGNHAQGVAVDRRLLGRDPARLAAELDFDRAHRRHSTVHRARHVEGMTVDMEESGVGKELDQLR